MEQIELDCSAAPECVGIKIYVEKVEKKKEQRLEKLEHKESIKERFIKLFRKAERDAKNIKEVVPIQRLEQQRVYRDYGMR
ncbi:MAG: hypothetical protein ACFFB0_15865 [Promethearchaeota archaeon]